MEIYTPQQSNTIIRRFNVEAFSLKETDHILLKPNQQFQNINGINYIILNDDEKLELFIKQYLTISSNDYLCGMFQSPWKVNIKEIKSRKIFDPCFFVKKDDCKYTIIYHPDKLSVENIFKLIMHASNLNHDEFNYLIKMITYTNKNISMDNTLKQMQTSILGRIFNFRYPYGGLITIESEMINRAPDMHPFLDKYYGKNISAPILNQIMHLFSWYRITNQFYLVFYPALKVKQKLKQQYIETKDKRYKIILDRLNFSLNYIKMENLNMDKEYLTHILTISKCIPLIYNDIDQYDDTIEKINDEEFSILKQAIERRSHFINNHQLKYHQYKLHFKYLSDKQPIIFNNDVVWMIKNRKSKYPDKNGLIESMIYYLMLKQKGNHRIRKIGTFNPLTNQTATINIEEIEQYKIDFIKEYILM